MKAGGWGWCQKHSWAEGGIGKEGNGQQQETQHLPQKVYHTSTRWGWKLWFNRARWGATTVGTAARTAAGTTAVVPDPQSRAAVAVVVADSNAASAAAQAVWAVGCGSGEDYDELGRAEKAVVAFMSERRSAGRGSDTERAPGLVGGNGASARGQRGVAAAAKAGWCGRLDSGIVLVRLGDKCFSAATQNSFTRNNFINYQPFAIKIGWANSLIAAHHNLLVFWICCREDIFFADIEAWEIERKIA
ncbi:hypothetical protein DFJ73DRAFT_760101 [Zopfochytrium polystomum]|nr:hypothetical protein DFJ73DRAFT_760101 [Zopfochytrium polystomum]